jgi:GT2 family glycosyltransferase
VTTGTRAPLPDAAAENEVTPLPAADVAVVIVNWNTVDLLDECLGSIERHGGTDRRLDVVVVDNASSDGSADLVRERWSSVRLIANDENVGFCRANNQAIRVTDAPAVLLINSDARLTEGCLDTMLDHLDRDPRAAIVGPRLEYGDGAFQRWTAGQELSLRSCANHFLSLDTFADRYPALAGIYLRHDTAVPFRPGWVSSAVMLVRREAFDDIGLLDERIFVYMDDVDLCQRALDGGWNIWYAADATAVHLMGASSKRETGRASPEALRSLNRWYARRHGKAAASALRGLEVVGFGGRAVAYGAAAIATKDPTTRRQAAAHLAHLRLALEAVDV